ncbi:trafficking protein particle complex protein 2 [Gigaspora rosea]|uniref:Trafficking protein particle complex protein 2 n=1 Tax=Gigaspora rosea TaxID=44941 RepID=A0A397UAW5_9GLOM|nr:trafficking protein particle complex protein 2 [Gigaspora rosea]
MIYYFAIVGTKDNPIYELDLNITGAKNEHRHLNQFIVHSALDLVEELQWHSNAMYLKSVDKFNEWHVSSFVSAGNIKFMLLHETKNEEGIRNFFNECYELYIKMLMNPFYELNTPITSISFDAKIRFISKKYL